MQTWNEIRLFDKRTALLEPATLSLSRFEQFAATITDKTAEVLQLPILVTGDDDVIVASSYPEWVGKSLRDGVLGGLQVCAAIPLLIESEAGILRVCQDQTAMTIAPDLARKVVQMVIDQVLLIEQLPSFHILKDKFLNNLLNGLITDSSVIELHANNLGLDLTPPRAVILIDASDYLMDNGRPYWSASDIQLERRVNSVISAVVNFFYLPNDTICAYMGQGEIAILKATDTKNLEKWAEAGDRAVVSSWANLNALKRAARTLLENLNQYFKLNFTIGLGRHHPGVTGLASSYKDARVALSLGRRFYGANRVHCLDELGIAAFAGIPDDRIMNDLAAHILSPLENEQDLIKTLISFFECNCSTAETSEKLSIHRNTLYYRLNKIKSLTGLDPLQFDEAVQIRLALLLHPSNS